MKHKAKKAVRLLAVFVMFAVCFAPLAAVTARAGEGYIIVLETKRSPHGEAYFQGGKFNGSPDAVESYGASLTAYAVPDEGWKFDHWQDEDGALVSKNNPYTFPVYKDMSLYAIFRDSSLHEVTLHLNGGTIEGENPTYVSDGGYLSSAIVPKKSGYGFMGWYEDASFTKYYYISEPVKGDLDLYALLCPKAVGVKVHADGWEKTDSGYRLKTDAPSVLFHSDAAPVDPDLVRVSDLYLDEDFETRLEKAPEIGTPYYFTVELKAGSDEKPVILWDDAMKTGSSGTAKDGTIEYVDLFRSPNSGSAMVLFKYVKQIADPVISSVDLSLTLPAPGGSYSGAVSAQVLVSGGEHVSVGESYWYNGGTPETNPGCGLAPETFKSGKPYYSAITIHAQDGWVFNDSTAITVNGETPSTWNVLDDGKTLEIMTRDHILPEPVFRTVTFDLDGGTMKGTNPVTVRDGETVAKPGNPEKEGYSFLDWYADKALTKRFDFSRPITADTTIYAYYVKHDAKITYEIIDGADQTILLEELLGDVVIRSDGPLEEFAGAKMDGDPIDPSQYEVESGSTILTLKKEYLSTLSAGTHILEMVYRNGAIAKTTLTIGRTPAPEEDGAPDETKDDAPGEATDGGPAKTGDGGSPALWIALAAASALLCGVTLRRRRDQR